MSVLAREFRDLAARGRRALIPFFTAGYPDRATFRALVATAAGAGADVVEIGIPFSDPLADGPAIQHSSSRALALGVNLTEVLAELRGWERATPTVIMTYVNPVMGLGWSTFARHAGDAAVAGVIVPDLPLEEAGPLERALASAGIDLIQLAAPTTGPARLAELGRRSRGFLYLVSVTGVTGARERLSDDFAALVDRARAATRLPLCAGFGISSRELARDAASRVDGVIVGSALVNAIRAAGTPDDAVEAVRRLMGELRAGLDEAAPGVPRPRA